MTKNTLKTIQERWSSDPPTPTIIKKVKKFLEDEASEEYNGDTLGMYIGGTIGTLMMVAMILWGGM